MSIKVQIDRRKDKKGNITLRLRWWFEGKREQLILGVRDDELGRSYAELVQKRIAHDLRNGTYITKDKYETPAKRKLSPKPEDEPDKITAVKLFENYAAFTAQDNRLSPGAIGRNRAIASKLQETLKDKPASVVTEAVAKNAMSMMSETLLGQTVKTYICLISACWDWAKDTYPSNPWSGCGDRVKNLQPPEMKVKFFTIDELETILGAFKSHPVYSFYFDYVLFLAQTACRPGEGASLRWCHLGSDFATAFICSSVSRGHHNPKGTKTGRSRTIQLTPSLRSMLLARHQQNDPHPNDLVFPTPKTGGSMDDHYFSQKVWKKVLEHCGVNLKPPYSIRHSAISHALDRGDVTPVSLAAQTGHSVAVLLRIYAHAVRDECLFHEFGVKPQTSELTY